MQQISRSIRESGLLAAGAFSACVALGFFASTKIEPTYTAKAKLLFTKVDTGAALTDLTGRNVGRLESLLIDQTPLTTQMQVIESDPILQQAIDVLGLRNEDGEPMTPGQLDSDLSVNIIGGTDVVEIKYVSEDPQTAAAVVNAVVDQYRENSIANNRAEASEAKEFLLAQLPQTELAVEQAENELRQFLEENNIGVLREEATSLVNQLEAVSTQAATVQSALEGTVAQSNAIQEKLGLTSEQAFLVGSIRQNPSVQQALADLQIVERELAAKQAQFRPNSPVIRQLQAEKDSLEAFLRTQIAKAGGSSGVPLSMIQGSNAGVNDDVMQMLIQDFLDTEVEYVGLRQQLEVLQNYQEDYSRRLTSIPSLSAQQRALERRIAVAEDTYSALLARIQELQVQENEATYNTRIIQPASPPSEADEGDQLKFIAAGVFGGAVVALAIIIASQILTSPFRKKLGRSLPESLPGSDIPEVSPSSIER